MEQASNGDDICLDIRKNGEKYQMIYLLSDRTKSNENQRTNQMRQCEFNYPKKDVKNNTSNINDDNDNNNINVVN